MKKFLILLIIISICILNMLNINKLVAKNTEVMAPAKAMVVLEGNTNTVLYEFNKDVALPMASVTKIATAIIAIESCANINEIVKISDMAVGIEGTSIYLKKGESLELYDLRMGLILASGNDCAVAIAEHFGGYDEFVSKMNKFASSLKLNNTHFDNPHGLDSETHYTSAYDLAIITSYALKNDIFKEIASTKYYTINENNISEPRYLKNKNKLLFSMDNCIGVKTGFTDNAGRCLVNAHNENDMLIISVVLNCQPMFEECKRLTDLALQNYSNKAFVLPYNYIGEINVLESEIQSVGVTTVEGFYKVIKNSDLCYYTVEYNYPKELIAPIELNAVVGSVDIYYKDKLIESVSLYSINEAKNINLSNKLNNIIENWYL